MVDRVKKKILHTKAAERFFVAPLIIYLVLISFGLTGCIYIDQKPKTTNVSSTGGTVEFSENDTTSKQKIVTFEVVGKGLTPETAISTGQARLLAERAAINDGYRQLVEKIRGVYIDAYSQTTNGIIDYDVIRTKTQSWLRGVEILEVKEAGYGIFNAKLQLRIYFTETDMIWWPAGIGKDVVPAARPKKSYLAKLFTGDSVRCTSYPWCGDYYYYDQR
ncbi:MAG: LPP20 family lipoprotein [Desulfamplus sp.]|nr:LPP20 family lipoprotein [Desulfamplus sp.]MBF0389902.1 LPP20 family lipoprotein [Desulfamplus sp.]